MTEPTRRSGSAGVLALVLALLAAGLLLARSLDAGFLTDDYHYLRLIEFGPRHAETWDPGRPFDVLRIFWTKASTQFELYRPLVILSYALDFHLLGGTDPFAYQLQNWLLHLLNGVLVFLLLGRLLPGTGGPARALGALLFLISPIQLEVLVWSATRSDAMSFFFGALALWTKLRNPKARALPALLVGLALLCKEQAIFWAVAIALADLFEPGGSPRGLIARVQTVLARGWPIAVLLLLYFCMRKALFGSFFQSNSYAKREFESFWSPALWRCYGRSLAVMSAPFSILAFPDRIGRTWLAIGAWAAGASILVGALMPFLRSGLRALTILAVLFAGPFLLAVMMNEVGADLVNTRACYTPFLGFAGLAALAFSRRLFRLPVLALAVLLAIGSRPAQDLYVECHREVEQAIGSIRGALAEASAARRTQVVILGYRELDFFRGSFDLSGAIVPALQRPFMERDHELALVGEDGPIDQLEHWTPFPFLFASTGPDGPARDLDDVVVLQMRGEPGRAPDSALCYETLPRESQAIGLRIASPPSGASATLDLARPAELKASFAFESLPAGDESLVFSVKLFDRSGLALEIPAQPPFVRTETTADGRRLWRVEAPLSAEVLRDQPTLKPWAFGIEARDAAGRLKAATPLRLFYVRKQG